MHSSLLDEFLVVGRLKQTAAPVEPWGVCDLGGLHTPQLAQSGITVIIGPARRSFSKVEAGLECCFACRPGRGCGPLSRVLSSLLGWLTKAGISVTPRIWCESGPLARARKEVHTHARACRKLWRTFFKGCFKKVWSAFQLCSSRDCVWAWVLQMWVSILFGSQFFCNLTSPELSRLLCNWPQA